jgi:outer membrane receptor protein involved in Fe transport
LKAPYLLIRIGLVLGIAAAALLAQATGLVSGTVFDAQSGRPIAGATVEVDGKPEFKTQTDADGAFRLTLPAGTYKLKYTAANYIDTTVDAIAITPDQPADGSTVMPLKSAVTTVDVVEKLSAAQANAEAMLTERKLAAAVSDGISSEEIRKTVASDAAGAVEKVTGVSIVDSGYVYVRGLGERYSATMLNNSILPSTEPERRVVPLDLFPANLIESIRVLKSYTPDLPGEFSGGLVQMQTIEFPTAKTFRVSASTGFNSVTTFNNFLTHRGGRYDALGFDDGGRGLPGQIPVNQRLFPGSFTEQQFQQLGQSFPVNYQAEQIGSMRPEMSLSVTGGNTFGKLGVVGAFTFTNKPQRYQELQRYLVNAGSRPIIFTDYPDFNSSLQSARMGGVLNVAYRFNPSNKIVFRNTVTRDTDKETRVFSGLNGGIDNNITATRLRWVERMVFSTGVEGEHSAPKLGNSIFRWQFSYSDSRRDEPDLRENIRETETNQFLPLPQSAGRFYNNLQDKIYEPLAEWGLPFFKGSISGLLKVGFRGTFRDRQFEARRFRFVPVRTQTLDFSQPDNILLGPSNIRPDGWTLRENTRSTDTYSGSMDVYGGFAMVDLTLGPRWRVVGGIRVEDADINVRTIDPLVPGGVPAVANLNNRDYLPGVSVIYALTARQNLRAGYGRTVNRPDFRELSPFDFTNVLGGFNTVGNPNLRRASIQNMDFRWEWFPGGDQVVAASYFFKDFKDPIEVTIQPTTDLRQSFLNADGARNQGIELEARKSLGFIRPWLAKFALQGNYTFVSSNIRIPSEQTAFLTSKQRPLIGQSRHIYNVIVDWVEPRWRSNARFFVNSVSRRITDVGTLQLPDIYQERNTFLDFVYQYDILENGRWNLRFTAENLGDNNYRWTQGDFLVRQYRLGRTFSIGTSFSFF